jgi:hypothetical protein
LVCKEFTVSSAAIEYFGMQTVERAVANFFARHGVSEDVRDYLMVLEVEKPDEFFQMVEDYVEGK